MPQLYTIDRTFDPNAPSASDEDGIVTRPPSIVPSYDFDWESIDGLPSYYFHCDKCCIHGRDFADGHYQITCDRCSIRQHAICHGIGEQTESFRFLCEGCERRGRFAAGGEGCSLVTKRIKEWEDDESVERI